MEKVRRIYVDNKDLFANSHALDVQTNLNKPVLLELVKEKDLRIAELERLLDQKTREIWKLKNINNGIKTSIISVSFGITPVSVSSPLIYRGSDTIFMQIIYNCRFHLL